jgi:predicted dehydrogenase
LAAVCDVERRCAEQVAAGWGANVFLGYEALLEGTALDALWVCVPPHLQGNVLKKAIEQRVPFFVEPPGAMDYERAWAFSRLAAEARLVTAVGFRTRYTDVLLEAREYIGTNPVPLTLGWWLCPADPGDHPRPVSPETNGKAAPHNLALALLWNEACRLIDAIRYFSGEIVRVHALTAGADRGGLVVQLELAAGVVAVLTCATFARPEPRIELELLGEGWSLAFKENLTALHVSERDKTTILRCMNDAAADHVQAFLAAVTDGAVEALPTGYGAVLPTLTVCHAAAISAREGRAIRVEEIVGVV